MANEKLMTEATADCFEEVTKIKTYFAKIIAEGSAEKPYYSILYYNHTTKLYYIGYSSYDIANVFNWLSECFEIADDPNLDVVEVVHGRWLWQKDGEADYEQYWMCSECKDVTFFKTNYCPNCGAKMDGDGNA